MAPDAPREAHLLAVAALSCPPAVSMRGAGGQALVRTMDGRLQHIRGGHLVHEGERWWWGGGQKGREDGDWALLGLWLRVTVLHSGQMSGQVARESWCSHGCWQRSSSACGSQSVPLCHLPTCHATCTLPPLPSVNGLGQDFAPLALLAGGRVALAATGKGAVLALAMPADAVSGCAVAGGRGGGGGEWPWTVFYEWQGG